MALLLLNNDKDPSERMFERLSKNPDVETGLHKLENSPNTDPEIRTMARAVLTECEIGRRKREKRKRETALAAIFALVFLFVFLIFTSGVTRH